MDGYTSIRDYLFDQKLLNTAVDLDMPRRGEMDIEKLMKKNIKKRFENATTKFKTELKKNKYTEFDLKLLSLNEEERHFESFGDYYKLIYGNEEVKINKFKKIIRSEAFKQGKIHAISKFIPHKIDTPRKLLSFLRRWHHGITDSELEAVMNTVGDARWEEWLEKYTEKGNVHFSNGRWHY